MKILSYVSKIYEPKLHGLTNDKSGLALYVHDIVRYLASHAQSCVTTFQFTEGGMVDEVKYVRHTKSDILKFVSLKKLFESIWILIKAEGGLTAKLKRAYFHLDVMRFESVIENEQPDIVNIHGCNVEMFNQIEVCQRHNVPFVISLHGLIGIDKTVIGTKEIKAIEGTVLKAADEGNWPIVAISTGVKNRAIKHYALVREKNIHIILNGCPSLSQSCSTTVGWCDDILSQGRMIVVCIGSICERKNQMQLIEAWGQLPEKLRVQYELVLLGKDLTGGTAQKCIDNLPTTAHIRICGFLEKPALQYIYEHTSLNVLASKDEGFGLSIIETMSYGVPSVFFNDIDAAMDLYSPETAILVNDRATSTLSKSIEEALIRKWDRNFIAARSKMFSMERVAESYMNLYRSICESSNKSHV